MASEETSHREPNNSWSLREKRRVRRRGEKGEGIERGRGGGGGEKGEEIARWGVSSYTCPPLGLALCVPESVNEFLLPWEACIGCLSKKHLREEAIRRKLKPGATGPPHTTHTRSHPTHTSTPAHTHTQSPPTHIHTPTPAHPHTHHTHPHLRACMRASQCP